MDGGRAGRVGEPQWQLAWLERGLTVPATDEGERAQLGGMAGKRGTALACGGSVFGV